MAGNLTLEQCVGCWVNRDASSNYGIDSDGNIACFVEEENRAWTSSSADNDNQAITVEVANLDNETGRISDQAWQSLVRLATDICHRYNFRLNFTGDPSGSLTMHKMFAATACPGPWIESHMNELAQTVNNNLDTGNFSYSGTASGISGTTAGTSTAGGMTKGTVVINDPAIAYAAGIEGQILFDQEEVYPFVITIDGNTQTELDFDKLKEFDVIGVCIDIGSYFTESHTINQGFRNQKLDEQFNSVKEAKLAIGVMTTLRAKNKDEALKELYEIRLAVRRYKPDIGLWLVPTFYSNDKEYNDELIKVYYDYLIKLGFIDQVGFYCKKEEMEKFNWEDVCEDWYWWMDRHLESVEKIHNMPTPKFFMYDDPADEDGLIEPDYEGWHALRATAGPISSIGGISGSGGYTDYQKAVSDAAESGRGCTTAVGWCAQFVTDVFTQARKVKSDIQVPYGNAIDYWTKWSSSGNTTKNAPVGSVVVGSGTAYNSDGTNPYGHVGVVLTEGRVADNWGYHRISDSIDAWASGQNAPCGSYVGYIGWVWANGQDLSKMGTMIGGGDPLSLDQTYVEQQVWAYLTTILNLPDVSAAAIMGAWGSESGRDIGSPDPTSIEGIFDEHFEIGPKKQNAMNDWQSYAYSHLSGFLNQYYRGEDGRYYPGVGMWGITGPKVTQLFRKAEEMGQNWFNVAPQLRLYDDTYFKGRGNWDSGRRSMLSNLEAGNGSVDSLTPQAYGLIAYGSPFYTARSVEIAHQIYDKYAGSRFMYTAG